jgi:hypothetical protein
MMIGFERHFDWLTLECFQFGFSHKKKKDCSGRYSSYENAKHVKTFEAKHFLHSIPRDGFAFRQHYTKKNAD